MVYVGRNQFDIVMNTNFLVMPERKKDSSGPEKPLPLHLKTEKYLSDPSLKDDGTLLSALTRQLITPRQAAQCEAVFCGSKNERNFNGYREENSKSTGSTAQ